MLGGPVAFAGTHSSLPDSTPATVLYSDKMFAALTGTSTKKAEEEDGIWQDRDIRFDTAISSLAIRPGEVQIDSINSVEDTKGNNGEKGSLAITNLRLIWICHRNSRINLSIGYSAVQSINIKSASSRLRGNTQALYVMTSTTTGRVRLHQPGAPVAAPLLRSGCVPCLRHLAQARPEAAWRDHQGQVAHSAAERAAVQQGSWRLESFFRPGNRHVLHHNVRLVWHASQAKTNVSIPYLQMKVVRVREQIRAGAGGGDVARSVATFWASE